MKYFIVALLTFILHLNLLSSVKAQNATSEPIRAYFDIAYKSVGGVGSDLAKLDIYSLPGSNNKRLMVFVHGGSWVGGDKCNLKKARGMISWFANRGYVVASPNFRLAKSPRMSNGPGYDDQARDIACAIKWLHKNAATYGVTEPSILLVGYSSGAHLVALLATDERFLKEVGLSHKDIQAAISFDVHAYDVPYALALMQSSELSRNIPLVLSVFGRTQAKQLNGSPVNFIHNPDIPPSLVISAGVPRRGSKGYIARETTKRYATLLRRAGHKARAVHFEDETHSSLVLDFGYRGDRPTQVVNNFLSNLNQD